MIDWVHIATRAWMSQVGEYILHVIQDEKTYEYSISVEHGDEIVYSKEGIKTKAKALKAGAAWLKEKKEAETPLFEKTCDDNCECPKCSDDCEEVDDDETNIKIVTTKITRKEKLEACEAGKSDLKLALWYIEKIGSTKRAKQVLTAACKAMDEIKKK